MTTQMLPNRGCCGTNCAEVAQIMLSGLRNEGARDVVSINDGSDIERRALIRRPLDSSRVEPFALQALRISFGPRDTQSTPRYADGCLDFARHERERSEEPTSELPYLMRNSYAVFCLK